jgi:hypothetical protein
VIRLFALALLSLAAFAEAPDIHSLSESEGPGAATLADIAWIEGRWIGEGLGGAVEEVYAPAYGGQMMGMFRYAREGVPQFYELMLFEERDGSLMFRVRHFNRDFSAWEDKAADETVDFPLVAVEGTIAYFDGTTFRNNRDGTMTVGLRMETRDGFRTELFEHRRAD